MAPAVMSQAMPDGRQWQGVYQGPYHIYLRILTRGTHASGNWQAIGGRNGEFTGKVSGNLLSLSWAESGSEAGSWSGRGYFVYEAAAHKGPDEIHGEWGLGSSSTGNSWWALRRADVRANTSQAALVDHDTADDEGGEPQSGEAQGCGVTCDDDPVNPD